jgi:imidazolonepropionase-like amidohydrolase
MLDGAGLPAAAARHKNGVDTDVVRGALSLCASHGVTFYRDGGDRFMVSAFAKKIAPEYGIDYRTPVFMLHKKGLYGEMFGPGFESAAECRALIGKALAAGADFIKLAVTGIMNFHGDGSVEGPELSEGELREAVNAAHGEGMAVMAHVNGASAIKKALSAGADSIEHGYWPDDETADILIQTGAVWTPTRAAVYNLSASGGYDGAVLRPVLSAQAAVLRRACAGGALIASGSDCGALSVAQGVGTRDEYSLLGELGIDPARGNERIASVFRRA